MPLVPKPKPPKRRQCHCAVCATSGRRRLTQALMGIVAASYTRAELLAVVRACRAALLPRDGEA